MVAFKQKQVFYKRVKKNYVKLGCRTKEIFQCHTGQRLPMDYRRESTSSHCLLLIKGLRLSEVTADKFCLAEMQIISVQWK